MFTFKKNAVIFFLALFLGAVPLPSLSNSNNETALVQNIRYGYSKEGVRIVLDLSRKPEFSYYSISDSSVITLDIFDAKLSPGFKPEPQKDDPLLNPCRIEQFNMRQVRMTIPLKYGLPIDNVDVLTLTEPDRIVIDLYRDYNNFIQFHITQNIAWLQIEKASQGRFTLVNELFVNYKSPDVRVDVELAKNSGKNREAITDMVKRTGAIAGINGGYFSNSGENLGLIVKDGKIVSPSVKRRPPRTAFGITFDNEILFNRVNDNAGKLVPLWGKSWTNIITALGGGPRLISDGKIHITAAEEGFGKGGNDITRRTGRTSLGVTSEGMLGLFTFSGFRSNHKDGVLLEDMAYYMKERSIINGMNLDGGGSTAMSIMGHLVSKAPGHGNFQRAVTNGIMIYDNSPIISPRYIALEPREIVLPADGKTETLLKVLIADTDQKPVPDKTPVAISSGTGLFEKKYHYTQNGLVHINVKSIRLPGVYTIRLECGPVTTTFPVKFISAEEAFITTEVRPAGGGAAANKISRFIIKALVRDAFKNPMTGKGVKFEIVEGEGSFSASNAITKPNGEADTTLTLKSPKAKVKVTAGGLEPLYLDF